MLAQKICEFFPFVRLLNRLDCNSFLEIGSLNGDTLLRIGCTMQKVVSVDMPGEHWGSTASETFELLRHRVELLRDRIGVNATLIQGNSTNNEVIARVASLGPFDVVFIDADHRYETVKKDWKNYGPLATKVVAFHDIDGKDCVAPRTKAKVGVPQLWREIKSEYKTIEFIEDWTPRPMGIGVVLIDS